MVEFNRAGALRKGRRTRLAADRAFMFPQLGVLSVQVDVLI